MPEPQLFEYAVIRVVPRVEREEFLNVGVILYCTKQKYLHCLITLNENRLTAIAADTDIHVIKENLDAFAHICSGGKHSGPIGRLDAASRFRWLTAARSTVVQTSKVHPGLCSADAGETLSKLHAQLVL